MAQSRTGNKPWRPEEIEVVNRYISSMTKMKPALTIAMEVEELLREGSDTRSVS